MKRFKFPEKSKSRIHYDREADVLYISFGESKPAEGIDTGDGTILRIDPKTKGRALSYVWYNWKRVPSLVS